MNQVITTTAADDRLEVQLSKMESKFGAALPSHIPAARFLRVALSAVANPMIKKATTTDIGRKSIMDACLKAASDGLLLDGREAALVQFNTKVKVDGKDEWFAKVQYMPMVAGILKKARNSGEISAIFCQVVYTGDLFEIDFVTDGKPITHKPDITGEGRGKAIGAYAVTRFKDGYWSQPDFMSVAEINKIRARSKSYDPDKPSGPWHTDWDEMGKKTVLKRHSKYLPSSTDKEEHVHQLLRTDNALYDIDGESTPALTETKQTRISAPAKKGAAAALSKIEDDETTDDSWRDDVGHDPETGEVIEGKSTPASDDL